MRPIFQLGYFPVGRKRERVTTRRERTCSGDEKAIRNTRQSVAASGKSRVDMTRPHKSLSLFIAHQPTDLRDRSNPESLCSAQMEELLGRGASVLHCNLHSLTTSVFRPDFEIVLHDDSTIGSTAEWGERTRHERTSGNENQLGLATGIDYLRRQSPLCSVVLRDHSREHLIRCQALFRMRSAILNDRIRNSFSSDRVRAPPHLGSSFSFKLSQLAGVQLFLLSG